MFSQRLWIAAALAASCALAPVARAQGTGGTGGSTTSSGAGSVRVTLISIGDDEVNTVGTIYLNRRQCQAQDDLLFKLDYVPSNKPSLDIYTGENCASSGTRGNTTNLSCKYLDTVQTGGVTMGLMAHVKAQKLVDDCTEASEANLKLWFLPVSMKMSVEDVNSAYGRFDRLQVDTAIPTPPVYVKGGEGENTIPVSWQGGQTHLKGFKVYIDPNAGSPGSSGGGAGDQGTSGSNGGVAEDGGAAGDGGSAIADAGVGVISTGSVDGGVITSAPNPDCPSSVLFGGGDPTELPSSVRKKTLDEPNATGTNLSPTQIGSRHAAVAVVAVDLAGNESVISNVECVNVVETTGFWDRYTTNGGEAESGCPCSAMGAAQARDAWPVALAVIALAWSARRRRSS
jgi:hypothetical protein